MSEQMKKSICKSAAYGETAEKTAEMHGCTAAEVQQIWNDNPDKILDYQAFYKQMGCAN
jgi:hypothetical protein